MAIPGDYFKFKHIVKRVEAVAAQVCQCDPTDPEYLCHPCMARFFMTGDEQPQQPQK